MDALKLWKLQLEQLLSEMEEQLTFTPGGFFVVGCSTSEVAGQQIGTAGAFEIGEAFYEPLLQFAEKHKLFLAFQGCEHINRALTIERQASKKYNLEPVSVIPVVHAGGSMSACAYTLMKDPVVVEQLQAVAGIDIGQTLIGMHLKSVAVPIRTSIKKIGEAIVTTATTRPKMIGGERAIYTVNQ
ncbi:TIGR01440 family protein [Sporosarcina sp. G11-34]|uniref:TIGR01440 family protein n=1 Tax=Sporosarcina sp. G11-34 TaxID=2849605 RepID=UPI0022A9B72C|nr:TIGR01440 family protein [Sporosarcina sp. G11-34]MCZ2257531.1 TIGR01440 family protein [Sporosarcina sp. G11-34]